MDQIEWIFNGLVVQEINNDPNGGFQQQYGYQGLGRYDSWILRYETDHISKMLTSKMENKCSAITTKQMMVSNIFSRCAMF
jgi:hypothetical protein